MREILSRLIKKKYSIRRKSNGSIDNDGQNIQTRESNQVEDFQDNFGFDDIT